MLRVCVRLVLVLFSSVVNNSRIRRNMWFYYVSVVTISQETINISWSVFIGVLLQCFNLYCNVYMYYWFDQVFGVICFNNGGIGVIPNLIVSLPYLTCVVSKFVCLCLRIRMMKTTVSGVLNMFVEFMFKQLLWRSPFVLDLFVLLCPVEMAKFWSKIS